MKILHITASYKPAYVYGGPIMSVAKLCEELLKTPVSSIKYQDVESREFDYGFQRTEVENLMSPINISVYTTLANGKEELAYQNREVRIVDGVPVHYFKRLTKDHSHASPALWWHLWKTARQFDIIHIHAWWNLVTMPACLIAILRGKKVVLTPRGTLSAYSFVNSNHGIKRLFHQLLGKRLLNRCYFHVTSKKEAESSKKLFRPKAIFTIPNFVELPWYKNFSINHKQSRKSPLLKLLFLSRIERKKGLELLFESLKEIELKWTLTIVGNGEEEYISCIKQKAESLKINSFINWLGPVYDEQKFDLIAQYDYLILPSYDENFANVVIESLFSGTSVIISKNVGLSDYIEAKSLGIVCERSQEDLIIALNTAVQEKQENKYDTERLNSVIRTDFEESVILKKYIHLYQRIIL